MIHRMGGLAIPMIIVRVLGTVKCIYYPWIAGLVTPRENTGVFYSDGSRKTVV